MVGTGFLAVGDIHGRRDLLDVLLDRLDADGLLGSNTLVFLGDMVDRGKDSYLVVSRVKELTETQRAIALLGNHEDMMLRDVATNAWRNPRESLWCYNGGTKTIDSYGGKWPNAAIWLCKFLDLHKAWMEALPLFYETEFLWFSHAPVQYQQSFRLGFHRTYREGLLWNTPHSSEMPITEGQYAADMRPVVQIVGHVHALFSRIVAPRFYPHIVYADTGCGCADWAPLSAVLLDEHGECHGYYQANPDKTVVFTPVTKE